MTRLTGRDLYDGSSAVGGIIGSDDAAPALDCQTWRIDNRRVAVRLVGADVRLTLFRLEVLPK